ncbi:MAG: efflux RND transporter periplasmic adaptor subunit [Sphingomonadales bacterium]|nr:MAG: efflux RND transporter periplasmic adaptor subunit [Sphingomonadales bacterium]
MKKALVVLLCASIFTTACTDSAKQQSPPATLVVVEAVQPQSIPNLVELPGRIEAVRTAEVRARVDGIVQRRLYAEGTDVREGTPLFLIDPREKRSQLAQAEAQLRRSTATKANAAQVVARFTPLVSRRAVSAQEYDAAVATLQQAEADVAQARALVDNARLQLSYTTVRAPLSGRVGQAAVTEGALVSGASATLMTRVDQLNPVYVTFTQSSAELMNLRENIRTGALRVPALDRVEVRLILENGSEYSTVGHLDFADMAVDPSTGSQIVRAEFSNPERLLLPGQFVRGRISAGIVPNGISVPQRAIKISEGEASVVLMGADDKAVIKSVVLGPLVDGRWIIRSGLTVGDRVVVEGWQKVRAPGQPLKIKPKSAPPAAAPAAAPSPTAG